MTSSCPVVPHFNTPPFALDRGRPYRVLHDSGDAVVTDGGVYLLIGAEAVEQAAKSPVPLVPIGSDPPTDSEILGLQR